MLTSFFDTSKPGNVIIVICYMTLAYFLANFGAFVIDVEWTNILKVFGLWLVYILTMFVLNFVARKNDLTKRNAFKILLFAAFTAALPSAVQHPQILLSGLFVMLSLRRIISLRSGKSMERKIFDASFWLALASVCYFWSISFAIVLYFGIMFYGARNPRYWIIPLLGAASVGILTTCYVLLVGDNQSYVLDYLDGISLDFSGYGNLSVLIAIAFLISIYVWSVFNYTREMRKASLAQRPIFLLVILISVIGLVIVILSSQKSGAEWYFFIPALCIIVSSYLEKASGKLFKELLLWIIVLLPVLIFYVS